MMMLLALFALIINKTKKNSGSLKSELSSIQLDVSLCYKSQTKVIIYKIQMRASQSWENK
jgi:hypothetical protein